MATPPFKFNERADQAFYHDVRIFIMGYDVTPWLTGAVSISYAGLGGMNNTSFTLSNHNYAFEMTLDNLRGKFRTFDAWTPQGMSSEAAKKWIYDLKNGNDDQIGPQGRPTGKSVPRNFKHKVKSWGPKRNSESINSKLISTPVDDSESFAATTDRFPFVVGSTVFHKNDQIRIFVKNPLQRFYNQWYVAFSGYLNSHVMTRDYVNGESLIRIQAQDIRSLMQKMRVQTNPSAQVSNENVLTVGTENPNAGIDSNNANAGYFNDLIADHAVISHVLGGKSFTQTASFLILGKDIDVGAPSADVGIKGKNLNAVAKFQAGVNLEYDVTKSNKKQILEQFTNLVNFGGDADALSNSINKATISNLQTLAPSTARYLNWEEMYKLGKETHPWTDSSVDSGRVHFLLPAKNHPASNLIATALTGSGINDKISWASRLELIYEVCNNIDYQMYVSGWGDIIFEFPMYDFDPDDFGVSYNKLYRFDQHVISDVVDDEGGEEVSGLIVSSDKLATQARDATQGVAAGVVATSNQLYTTIFSNVLASRIGVNLKTVTRLGITDQDVLAQFGFLEFNKIIAEYSKYSLTTAFRPYLSINRPIHSIHRDRIGVLDNFTNTWNVRGDVTSNLNLRYVRRGEYLRGADGKLDLTKAVFRSIVGGEATPISYNKIYVDKSLKDIGVGAYNSGARKGQGTQEGD